MCAALCPLPIPCLTCGGACATDYDPLPKCESWCGVIWGYVTNPKLGAYSRVKRRKEVDASESARTLLPCPAAVSSHRRRLHGHQLMVWLRDCVADVNPADAAGDPTATTYALKTKAS